MIVYVESNFVLELAYLQEQYEHCLALLRLAETKDIDLVLPAFSIGEPYEAWVRRSKHRRELRDQLEKTIRELSRSRPYQEATDEFQELTKVLLTSGEEEKRRLDDILERILQIVEVIPLGLSTIRAATTFQKRHSLSPQDAIVYASVLEHLASAPVSPRCFITRNSKDFLNPDIEGELATCDCRLLTQFDNGLGYVRSRL